MYKRQRLESVLEHLRQEVRIADIRSKIHQDARDGAEKAQRCLLYTSDAADERSSVDLGGRRIIKKKTRSTRIRT